MNSIWDKPTSHGEILKKIWKHLDLGVLEREHPFHTPVFGTVASGCTPRLRVIVLRRFWRKNPRSLVFHTHIASPKVREIQNNPNVSFAFYHAPEKLQLSVAGSGEIYTSGALHEEQWQATGFFSRRAYAGAKPSERSVKPTSGLPEDLTSRKPTREESELGKSNFAVVFTRIDSIDCLELDGKGKSPLAFPVVGDGRTRNQVADAVNSNSIITATPAAVSTSKQTNRRRFDFLRIRTQKLCEKFFYF